MAKVIDLIIHGFILPIDLVDFFIAQSMHSKFSKFVVHQVEHSIFQNIFQYLQNNVAKLFICTESCDFVPWLPLATVCQNIRWIVTDFQTVKAKICRLIFETSA